MKCKALLSLITLPMLSCASELIPFIMPWDDDSNNVTNLSWTLEAPAGAQGQVEINTDGHYVLDGERIRFFGVNIGAASCFPPQEKAASIARRLASFGMNVVRFHHMDNRWTKSIIDYGKGHSKDLHLEHLDRFDKLVFELKQAGIYSNINLLCSRVFLGADGLHPDVDSMDWKETHILGFFDEGARNLQKEFALKLLTHRNPYTGLTYVEDPAVAFIEVNNENGMIHQWHSQALDRLPRHYSRILRNRWNQWLQSRYPTTPAMLESWGSINEVLGSQLILRGNFTPNHDGWNLETHQNARASVTLGNFFNGNPAARIQIEQIGSAGWHVQFTHPGIEVAAGQIYTLRFWARSSAPRNLSVSIMQAYEPWGNLGYSSSIQVGTEWQSFEATFFISQSSGNARFNLGELGHRTGTVEIAQVELRTGGQLGGIPEGSSVEAGNVPLVSKTQPGVPGQTRDWLSFLRDLELDYWSDMDHFVRSLGYEGLTWGTTVMNSTPNIQSVYDSIDSHSYWQHPSFVGQDWNPENWTVGNVSMVNDTRGGTIRDLSWQRVRGKPHNVTEYQHPSPNPYNSEGPLFIAAYASLQDWDGIYLFHYGSGDDDWDRGYFSGFFDMDQHPSQLANASIASLIFRRMDLQPARQRISIPFSMETELDVMLNRGGAWNVGDGRHLDLPDHLPLIHRFELVTEDRLSSGAIGETVADSLIAGLPSSPQIYSDTGELLWDLSLEQKGAIVVNTHRARGAWGFQSGRTWEFDRMRIRVGTTLLDWATVMLVFTEGPGFADLKAAGRGLIVVTGVTENTHMGWKDSSKTSVGTQWGSAPVMVENIPVELLVAVPPHRIRVWSLDPKGDRKNELPRIPSREGTWFELGGSDGSLWYEFEIRQLQDQP